MKAIVKSLMIIAVAGAVSLSCNKNGDETDYTQSLRIDSESHVLDKGMLTNYGQDETGLGHKGTNIDLHLVSSGIQLHFGADGSMDSASGDGYVLYLQMYSPLEDEFANGTYVYSSSLNTGTFDAGEVIVIENGKAEDYYLINEGSITTRKTDGKYGITGELTTKSGQDVAVSYRGALTWIMEQ